MPTRVRVFRADTPVDVWCASIVAETLDPGPTVLAVSVDKTYADDADYLGALDRAATLHPWDAVVHLPDLPVNDHWLDHDQQPRRLRRLLDTRTSVRLLRRTMAAAIPGPVEWESFVTCMTHPDIRAFVHALRPVANHYTPHSFLSPNVYELVEYAHHAHPASTTRPIGRSEQIKRALLGRDAVIPTSVPVDAAYSFTVPAPWADRTIDLGRSLADVTALFDRLPADVRASVDALADRPGPVGLLVTAPEERDESYPEWLELDGLVELARHVVDREALATLLVKPHPRNGRVWIDRVVGELRGALEGVAVEAITAHGDLPIEAIAARVPFAAVTGLGSTALVTLSRHLGVRAYCPERLVVQLLGTTPDVTRGLEEWFDDNREHWVVVALSTDHHARSADAPPVR